MPKTQNNYYLWKWGNLECKWWAKQGNLEYQQRGISGAIQSMSNELLGQFQVNCTTSGAIQSFRWGNSQMGQFSALPFFITDSGFIYKFFENFEYLSS